MKAPTMPVSLRLDRHTLDRATAFAKRRKVGVTAALRMLINDGLNALDEQSELGEALLWQRREALATLQRLQEGKTTEISVADLRETHAKALRRHASK